MRIITRLVAVPLCAALLILPELAAATLGGDASTPQADQLHMHATLRTSPGARYSVHELAAANGTTVREFVSPQGVVFAVAWQGPVKPDLRQLLGSYFDRYLQIAPNTHGAHAAVAAAQPDLVIRSSGHMRAFSGHAYLPSAVPADIDVGELR